MMFDVVVPTKCITSIAHPLLVKRTGKNCSNFQFQLSLNMIPVHNLDTDTKYFYGGKPGHKIWDFEHLSNHEVSTTSNIINELKKKDS